MRPPPLERALYTRSTPATGARRLGHLLAAAVVATACGGGGSTPPGPNANPVATVALTVTTAGGVPASSVERGRTVTVTALLKDAANVPLTGRAIAWTSDTSVRLSTATSTDKTVATGITSGSSAAVTATVEGKTASVMVLVTAPSSPAPSAASVGATTLNCSAAAGWCFTPTEVRVAPTGTVTWTFGSVAHNATFDKSFGAPASTATCGTCQVSAAFSVVGTYNYTCTLHLGMAATVVVQ